MAKRRSRKPKRKFPGIRAIWSGGHWKWQAIIKVNGRQVVGSLRLEQEDAYQDHRHLKLTREALPKEILALEQAVRKVVQDARKRGLPSSTIKKSIISHANYLFRFWKPETAMTDIDAGEIQWFIRLSLSEEDEDGRSKLARSPNTLRQKDLPLLKQCFHAAGLACPGFNPPKGVPPPDGGSWYG